MTEEALSFRRLGSGDLDGFWTLYEEIRAAAPPGSLTRRGREDLGGLLGQTGTGFALGVFVDGRLAGFTCASHWRSQDLPRFEAIGLPRHRWDRTAVLTATAVAAWARGRGLQRRLLAERRRSLALIGATHGVGVIHVANLRSLTNTLSSGEPALGVLDDEDGVNYVSLSVAGCEPGPCVQGPVLRLQVHDLESQRAAFARGMWCWALEGEPDAPGSAVLVFAAPDPGCT